MPAALSCRSVRRAYAVSCEGASKVCLSASLPGTVPIGDNVEVVKKGEGALGGCEGRYCLRVGGGFLVLWQRYLVEHYHVNASL